MDIKSVFASMIYKKKKKKTSGSAIKSEIMSNQKLAKELQRPIITKFEKRKVYSSVMDNIWVVDLANM